jgi:hypothetical protein
MVFEAAAIAFEIWVLISSSDRCRWCGESLESDRSWARDLLGRFKLEDTPGLFVGGCIVGKRSLMPLKIVFGVWGGSGFSNSASILRFGWAKLKVRGQSHRLKAKHHLTTLTA